MSFCFMFVQPFMAYFRPGPDSPGRPVFRAAHFTLAVWAVALAYVAIFYSTLDPNVTDSSLKTIASVLLVGGGLTILNLPASFMSSRVDGNKVAKACHSTFAIVLMLTVQVAGMALIVKICLL